MRIPMQSTETVNVSSDVNRVDSANPTNQALLNQRGTPRHGVMLARHPNHFRIPDSEDDLSDSEVSGRHNFESHRSVRNLGLSSRSRTSNMPWRLHTESDYWLRSSQEPLSAFDLPDRN